MEMIPIKVIQKWSAKIIQQVNLVYPNIELLRTIHEHLCQTKLMPNYGNIYLNNQQELPKKIYASGYAEFRISCLP